MQQMLKLAAGSFMLVFQKETVIWERNEVGVCFTDDNSTHVEIAIVFVLEPSEPTQYGQW